jgi:hypothetical protein
MSGRGELASNCCGIRPRWVLQPYFRDPRLCTVRRSLRCSGEPQVKRAGFHRTKHSDLMRVARRGCVPAACGAHLEHTTANMKPLRTVRFAKAQQHSNRIMARPQIFEPCNVAAAPHRRFSSTRPATFGHPGRGCRRWRARSNRRRLIETGHRPNPPAHSP